MYGKGHYPTRDLKLPNVPPNPFPMIEYTASNSTHCVDVTLELMLTRGDWKLPKRYACWVLVSVDGELVTLQTFGKSPESALVRALTLWTEQGEPCQGETLAEYLERLTLGQAECAQYLAASAVREVLAEVDARGDSVPVLTD